MGSLQQNIRTAVLTVFAICASEQLIDKSFII